MFMKRNFYLTGALNNKLEMLKQAGFIDYWRRDLLDKRNLRKDEHGPKVITLNHVAGNLQVLLAGIILSLIVFIIELKFPQIELN